MSSHRYTDKPRLLHTPRPAPATVDNATPAPQPLTPAIDDGTSAPSLPRYPYPGVSERHPNRARRHWLSIFSALLVLCGSAQADPREQGLAFRSDNGWLPALALDTAVEMQVHGLIAEVTIRQSYVNDSDQWQEGRYLLPLPGEAAVGSLRVTIGSRLIEGEVREKEVARQIYNHAAQQGQTAALVEQMRPNLFRTGLTNIGPGESINVEIGYWQAVTYRDGVFSLSLPLTLKPRYESLLLTLAADERVNELPRQTKTAGVGLEPTVSLDIELHAGVPLAGIDSPTHAINVAQKGGFQHVTLSELVELADRDFELQWRPLPSSLPQRAVFSEEIDGEQFALLMLLPPSLPVQPLPREMILVIDTSGSMHGSAIQQAIAAVGNALDQLGANDRFNVIHFSNISARLFPESVPVSAASVGRARRHIAGLRAEGGTEMAPALSMAFEGAPPSGMVRQVVLATDAAIGNEAELLNLIERSRGAARLFPIGIGSAPNAHFIRKSAELGRGSQVLIRDISEVGERMRSLFARLDKPVLHDIDVQWPDAIDIYPPRLPDLYAGEPLQVIARLPRLQGELSMVGQTHAQPWRSKLRLDPLHVVRAEGIGRLWARARIEAIEDAMRVGLAEPEGRSLIIETALQHGLASRYTSLIAVERTPSRRADAALAGTDIPNATPADSLAMAQGSSGARGKLGLALTLVLMALAVWRRREPEQVPGLA